MTAYRGSGMPGVPVQRSPGAADRIPAQRRPEGWRLRATALVWDIGWEVSRRLPEPVAFAAADLGARLAHRRARARPGQLAANLRRVVPDDVLAETVERAFRSYGRYWVEAFRAADIPAEDIDLRTTTSGFEHLDAALDEGKGAIVLLAHHGSWDLAAQWAETHGYHLAVVAEVVRPRRLFEKFVRLRETVGLDVVPLARGGDLVGALEKVLRANHIAGLLADRDLTRRGPLVEFFGEPARLPPGPVILSRRTGAPVVPATMLQRPGRRWHLQVLERVDVQSGTVEQAVQRVAHALERLIMLDPAQWHAFQPVWLADLHTRRGGATAGSDAANADAGKIDAGNIDAGNIDAGSASA